MSDHEQFEDGQFPDNDEYIPYVTIDILARRHGVKVSLWGKFTKVSASNGFYVKTVDDQEILIRLKKPLNELLEGWYEIHGVAQGKCVLCDEYISFSEKMTAKIDVESQRSLATLLAALDDPWNLDDQESNDVQGYSI